MEAINIRVASPDDAAALLGVYAPYVERTAISFETEVPSVEEFRARIEGTIKKYPYLAAEREGRIVGYALTKPFVGRAAYDHAAEMTIYLSDDARGLGLGRRLYAALEELSRAQNIYDLYACIGWTDQEDEHLTNHSAAFHARLGFRLCGAFRRCGYKFGRWYDMIWMGKVLSERPEAPPPVAPFPELPGERVKEVLCGTIF